MCYILNIYIYVSSKYVTYDYNKSKVSLIVSEICFLCFKTYSFYSINYNEKSFFK